MATSDQLNEQARKDEASAAAARQAAEAARKAEQAQREAERKAQAAKGDSPGLFG